MAGAARSVAEDVRVRDTKLTALDRATIYNMRKRGDRIQDVAYWFGISPSTVWKIEHTWLGAGTLEYSLDLPPPGPYALVQRSQLDELEVHKAVITELEGLLAKVRQKTVTDKQLVQR